MVRIPSLSRRTDDRPVAPDEPTEVRERRPRRVEAEPGGPRPRSSGIATVGLVLAVLAAAAVATGVLAAPGVALGVLAMLFGLAGISATRRRHVAGRSESLFAVLLGAAAVVFGVLAFTDTLSWLSSDTNQVTRLRDWLYDNVTWLDDL